MYLRFTRIQRVVGEGQSTTSEDAVKATRRNGSAQSTEYRMMNSVPRTEWKSAKGRPRQIVMLITAASSPNSRQALITAVMLPPYPSSVVFRGHKQSRENTITMAGIHTLGVGRGTA